MNLSEARKQAAYNAIADTVMDARVNLRMRGFRDDKMDLAIAQITERAWQRLKHSLNIHDAPSNGGVQAPCAASSARSPGTKC